MKGKKTKKTSSLDYYLLPNKIISGVGGMWIIEEKSSKCTKLFAYFRIIFGLFTAITLFVPELMMIIVNWGSMRVLARVGSVSTTVAQLLFKMFYLIARRKTTLRMYYELRDLWDVTDDPEKRRIYEKFANLARILTIAFFTAGFCNVLTFTIAAAIDSIRAGQKNETSMIDGRHFTFEVWYGIDLTTSPRFEIAFVYQTINAFICATTVCGLDGTLMAMVLHVTGQFKLLSAWINDIGIKMNNGPYSMETIEADFIRCIRHHQRILTVVNDLNDLLTPMVFVQILTSGIEICLSVYSLTYFGKGVNLPKFLSYLASMNLQLVLFCGPGEMLIEKSLEVGSETYFNVPWYDLPVAQQKIIILIMVRAQQSCSVSALTFQELSVHTLTIVFNGAASFFTLLRQMQ